MSFLFGGSRRRERGRQTIELPPPSPAARELEDLNLQLARRQLAMLQREEEFAETERTDPSTALQREIETMGLQRVRARLKGEDVPLSPNEQAMLDRIYGTATEQGQTDLLRFAEQMSAERGLTTGDSPMSQQFLREGRRLSETMQGQKAASSLDLGAAAADFAAAQAQFSNQLKQQAFMNRMALAGITPPSFGLQQQMFGERFAQGTRRTSGVGTGFNWQGSLDLNPSRQPGSGRWGFGPQGGRLG